MQTGPLPDVRWKVTGISDEKFMSNPHWTHKMLTYTLLLHTTNTVTFQSFYLLKTDIFRYCIIHYNYSGIWSKRSLNWPPILLYNWLVQLIQTTREKKQTIMTSKQYDQVYFSTTWLANYCLITESVTPEVSEIIGWFTLCPKKSDVSRETTFLSLSTVSAPSTACKFIAQDNTTHWPCVKHSLRAS